MNQKLAETKAKANGHRPIYYSDGNFTLCVILLPDGREIFGFAKCNPNCDTFNLDRGKQIAYARAMKKMIGE